MRERVGGGFREEMCLSKSGGWGRRGAHGRLGERAQDTVVGEYGLGAQSRGGIEERP